MNPRLKVVMSAYACRPGKGSEPEIGWQWAMHMARFHDLTVFTRTKNRGPIEAALEPLQGRQPLPVFKYHEASQVLLRLKPHLDFFRVYYVSWQRSVRKGISSLLREANYDLLHHVTFSAYRYPTAIWRHGLPAIWGPIGGIESVPAGFLRQHNPKAVLYELVRGSTNLVQNSRAGSVFRRARASDLTVACTHEMHALLRKLGLEAQLMSSVGMPPDRFPDRNLPLSQGPLKLLYVGNVIALKGLDLALEALAASQTDARFSLIGDGDFLEPARGMAQQLGLGSRVEFKGRLPQPATLAAYRDFDLFLFPSLHDTGGFAVLEAMANYLPVICLAVGGPAVMVNGHSGFKIPLRSRDVVVKELAEAIRAYDRNRALVREHANGARQRVLRDFSWEQKAETMSEFYRQVVSQRRSQARP